jgi:hypothetical protein
MEPPLEGREGRDGEGGEGGEGGAANSSQVEEPDCTLEVPGGAVVNSMLVLAEGGTQGRAGWC